MFFRRLFRFVLVIVPLLVASHVFAQTPSHEHQGEEISDEMRVLLNDVRGATAKYHDLATAQEADYGKFLDCFTHGEGRGMGQHYVNGDAAGNDILDPLIPEALVYQPLEDGTMVMVAFEYLVFAELWDPKKEGREAPTLFGQKFTYKTNIPETPPVWTLHIWLWTHNPEGLFADYNPIIVCPKDYPIVDMSQM